MPLELQKAAVTLVFAVFFMFLNIKTREGVIVPISFFLMIGFVVVSLYFAATWMW